MRLIHYSLCLAVVLSNCTRSTYPPPVPLEDDPSIKFPHFFGEEAIEVGATAGPYELDGVTLRALAIAANDFLPPGGKIRPCEYTHEAHRYRIMRQGNIIFIYILPDDAYCGLLPGMDGGVRYAISTDGRILRRLIDGQPEEPLAPIDLDAGGWGPPTNRVGISPEFDARWNRPDGGSRGGEPRDGGSGSPLPAPPPAPSSTPDAGSSPP